MARRVGTLMHAEVCSGRPADHENLSHEVENDCQLRMNGGRGEGVLARLTERPRTWSSMSGAACDGSGNRGRVVRGCVLTLLTMAALAADEEPCGTSLPRFHATGQAGKVSERANDGASPREGHR